MVMTRVVGNMMTRIVDSISTDIELYKYLIELWKRHMATVEVEEKDIHYTICQLRVPSLALHQNLQSLLPTLQLSFL